MNNKIKNELSDKDKRAIELKVAKEMSNLENKFKSSQDFKRLRLFTIIESLVWVPLIVVVITAHEWPTLILIACIYLLIFRVYVSERNRLWIKFAMDDMVNDIDNLFKELTKNV